MSEKIRVIVFKGANGWLAQGLERDICVQAKTLDSLYARFQMTLHLESECTGGIARIPEAPKNYFDMWDDRASDAGPVSITESSIEYGIAA